MGEVEAVSSIIYSHIFCLSKRSFCPKEFILYEN